jgi:dephospho-CoA kinase
MIIGITGGTGSGKTTLLELVREQGGLVLDCDAIYHELLRTDEALLGAIEARFPGTVENGTLQRKKLGNIVFSDKSALIDLNKITHSAIRTVVLHRLAEKPALAAIDAVALFESGLADLCDVTVAVTAPGEIRIQRLMEREGISAEYAQKRIAAQPTDDFYQKNANYLLVNDGSLTDFQRKCLAFFADLGIIK